MNQKLTRRGRRNADKGSVLAWSGSSLSDSHRLEAVYRLLGGNESLLRHLFDQFTPKLRRPADELLRESLGLSHGERLLIQAALDLWCNQGGAQLGELLDTWDSENVTAFVRALCHLREIRNPVMHALIDDENCGIPL